MGAIYMHFALFTRVSLLTMATEFSGLDFNPESIQRDYVACANKD